MENLTDITNSPDLETKIANAVTAEIIRRLPNAPMHEIATFIVKNAPQEAKDKMTATALLKLLTFKQIINEQEAFAASKVLTGFLYWNGELADAIMRELAKRISDFYGHP